MNYTRRFIAPSFKQYGPEFIKNIRSIYCLNAYISDGENKVDEEDVVYFVFKVDTALQSALLYFMSHHSYVTDYPIGEKFHIIVLRIHENLKGIVSKLKQSKFSELHIDDEISQYFNPSENEYHILKKSPQYKKVFEKQINELTPNAHSDTWINLDDLDIKEYEFPIKLQNEILNYEVSNS